MKIEENFVFPVYLYENILKTIKNICKKHELEIFGYLVGEIFSWKEKKYVIIEDQISIKAGTHSQHFTVSHLEGTAGKFEEEFQKLKRTRKNENLRIIGWWHSHPNFGCFLSSTDVETQQYFFPESYQVALVVDPIRDEFDFYSVDKNSKEGYKPISYAILSIN